MNWSPSELLSHVKLSLRDPRRGGIGVLEWDIPALAVGPLVVLSVIFSTLAAEFSSALNPPAPGQPAIYIAPLAMALILLMLNVSLSLAISVLGRAFGGTGAFREALLLVSWHQFIQLCLFVILAVLGLLLPAAAALLVLVALFYLLWVMAAFIAVLHGFPGMGLPFAVLILASLAVTVVLYILVSIVGVAVIGGTQNV